MPTAYKVLGQAIPAAGVLTDLYTVPNPGSSVISSITVCNQASGATTFRVSIAVDAAADATRQYVFRDVPLAGNGTVVITAGLTLDSADVLRVSSANGSVSFGAFGQETT